MRISNRMRRLAALTEEQHPEITIALESVTRNHARLKLNELSLEFVYQEGQLLLNTSYRPDLPGDLYRLLFFRAAEAIEAVRTGHREAVARRTKASSNSHILVRQKNLFP